MKLQKGQTQIAIPDLYSIHYVGWRDEKQGFDIALHAISETTLAEVKKDVFPEDFPPSYFCRTSYGIQIWPPAPKDAELVVGYLVRKQL